MSAAEVIERIKELPDDERAQVARFVAENGGLLRCRTFSISAETDGLPVIRANGGAITSQLVREIESRTPMDNLVADTWEKIGPPPEVDYDKL